MKARGLGATARQGARHRPGKCLSGAVSDLLESYARARPRALSILLRSRASAHAITASGVCKARPPSHTATGGPSPIAAHRAGRFGVKGDLALGTTGFVYCRYGGFQGQLADKERLYNPDTKETIPDPRFLQPYPNFIKQVPDEIKKIIAPISHFGPSVSELVSMKFKIAYGVDDQGGE
jgi:hypothetical protein